MTKNIQKTKLTRFFPFTNYSRHSSSQASHITHITTNPISHQNSVHVCAQTASSPPTTIQKRSIFNPYTKNVDSTSVPSVTLPPNPRTFQTKLDVQDTTCPLDNKWIGTKMSKKPHGWRILLQNPNGVNIDDNFADFKTMLYELRHSAIDMTLLSESKINPSNTRARETLKDMQEKVFPGGEIFLSNTPKFPPFTPNQPGGVLTLVRRKLRTRISAVHHDPIGRWTKITFYGKTTHLHIYNIYRVNPGSIDSGDSTAWVQQHHHIQTHKNLQYKNKQKNNPRSHIIHQLLECLESDLLASDEIILAGDFNEHLTSSEKTGDKLSTMGLQQVFSPLITPLPRSTKNGHHCIDHIWTTGKVSNYINALGICPFDEFCPSDHRAFYIDLDVKTLLDYTDNPLTPQSFRRLKTSIVPNLKKYHEQVTKQCRMHKLQHQFDALKEAFKMYGKDQSNIKRLNKLDSLITRILKSAEKKCSKASRHCIDDWSPELRQVYRSKRNISQQILKIKRSPRQNKVVLESLITQRREIRQRARAIKKDSVHYREKYLQELALYKADNDQEWADKFYATLVHIEHQRRQAKLIRSKIKSDSYSSLLYILIPAASSYSHETDHYNVNNIWKRIQVNNGHDISEWERIESRPKIEALLLQWMHLHSAQSSDSPLSSNKWQQKLQHRHFRTAILKGEYVPDPFEKEEINEMFRVMHKYEVTSTVPFEYTYKEFLQFITTCKEKTSSSPSGRHLGHYKALFLLEESTMLQIIHGILSLSLQYCVPLKRYCQVVTTLLEKDQGFPKIHRLRPITIVEAELNAISKSYWSKKLAAHIERTGTMTESQYGGRKNRQAQSAVLNKLLYYNYQFLMAEDAAWVDKDARNCFDRLLPALTTLQSECHGAHKSSSTFMLKSLAKQKIKLKTGFGVTLGAYSSTKTKPIFGTGQGMGWSLLACNTNLNVVDKCMNKFCAGMRYQSPDRSIIVSTIGDCFVDDTEHGVNVQTNITQNQLIQQIQHNDQKHTFYWHVTGGRIAVDKCSWYHLTFDYKKGAPNPIESSYNLETSPDYISPKITVPKYHIHKTHKTLGCKVSPSLSQTDQLNTILQSCTKWANKVTNSTLSSIDILHSYKSILLPSIRYRLVTSMLSFQQCDTIFTKVITPLLHAHSLHRHFNQSIAIAPATYGGLGIQHFFYIQGIEQIKFLIMHYRRNDKTGKLIKIILQLTQLHCGVSVPFYTQDFSKFHNVVPTTWFSSIWSYMSTCGITMTESSPWTLSPPRVNDKCLMDLLIPHIPDKKTHAQLNWCRLFLKVVFVSDVTDYNGRSLLPNILTGCSHRTSKWSWPKCEIPETWWKLWTAFLTNYVQPHIQMHPLGRWITSSHQQSEWLKTSNGLIYNSSTKMYYAPNPNSHRKYSLTQTTQQPTFSHELDVIPNSPTNVSLLSAKQLSIPTATVKTTSCDMTFLNYHPSNLSKKTKKRIRKHLRNDDLIAASDGSAHEGDKGSFAFCYATKTGDIIFQSYSPTLCDSDSIHSDRSEICGLLGIVTTINTIIAEARTPSRYAKLLLTVWTDSETAICAATKPIVHSTRTAFKNNIDVIMELQHHIHQSPIQFDVKWVEAHQNRDGSSLPVEARLNVTMDALAEKQYSHNNSEFHDPIPHMHAQQISFSTPYYRITGDFHHNLLKYHRDLLAEQQVSKVWKIDAEQMSSVNWKAIKTTFSSLDLFTKAKLTKALYRQWDTSERKNKWSQYSIPATSKHQCPLCFISVETCDHVLRCPHVNMREARKLVIREFDSLLKSLHTQPTLRRRLICVTQQWLHNHQISAPKGLTGFPKIINKAIREQKRISFSNLFRGVLVTRWEKIQQKHLSSIKNTLPKQFQQASYWSHQITLFLLKQTHHLWKIRCETVQIEQHHTSEEMFRNSLLSQRTYLQQHKWQLRAIDRYLLNKTDKFFKITSKTNLYLWKARIELALRTKKEFEKSFGTDIRKWVKITSKHTTPQHRKFVRLKGRRRLCKFVTPPK